MKFWRTIFDFRFTNRSHQIQLISEKQIKYRQTQGDSESNCVSDHKLYITSVNNTCILQCFPLLFLNIYLSLLNVILIPYTAVYFAIDTY